MQPEIITDLASRQHQQIERPRDPEETKRSRQPRETWRDRRLCWHLGEWSRPRLQSIVICKCLCSSGTERSWRIAAHIEAFICFCAYAKDMPGNAHSGGGAGNADAREMPEMRTMLMPMPMPMMMMMMSTTIAIARWDYNNLTSS